MPSITIQSLDKKTSTKAKGTNGQFLDFWNVLGNDDRGAQVRYTCWSPAILNKLNCTLELGRDYTIEDKGNGYIKMNLTDVGKGKSETSTGSTGSCGKAEYVPDTNREKAMYVSYAKDLCIAAYTTVSNRYKDNPSINIEIELYKELVMLQKAVVDTADLMLFAITGKPKDEALGGSDKYSEYEPF
jgi:hypothetical protein